MAVRTKQLAVADSAPATQEKVIYTAPAGETVILKDFHVSLASGNATRAVLFVNSGPRRVSLMDRAVGALDQVDRATWLVMNGGDTVGVFSQGGVVNVWLSGTELEGVAD